MCVGWGWNVHGNCSKGTWIGLKYCHCASECKKKGKPSNKLGWSNKDGKRELLIDQRVKVKGRAVF